MDFRSQIELPVPAEDLKSPVRKTEFDGHCISAKHIVSGVIGQLCVMTSQGPKMMFARVQCSGSFDMETRYSSPCFLVYNDTPPQP